MDITFTCDLCGQEIVIDGAGAGSTVECPKCKSLCGVPGSTDATVEERPTGKLPLPPRVPAVASTVIVQKIQGLPLAVRTANEPLRVQIVGLRVSWGDVWDASVKVVCCLSLFGLVTAICAAILWAVFH